MIVLLKEYLQLVMNERTRDASYRKLAIKIYDDLLAHVDGKSVDALGMKVANLPYGGAPCVYATFSDLNVSVPDGLGDLTFGIAIGDDVTTIRDGFSTLPNQFMFAPDGLIALGINDFQVGADAYFGDKDDVSSAQLRVRSALKKLDSIKRPKDIDVGSILKLRRSIFIHELVHQFDLRLRDNDGLKVRAQHDLKNRSYYDSELEINAYYFTAFEDMVETFEKETDGTIEAARKFAPDAETLWQHFESHLDKTFKEFPRQNKNFLRKRYLARLVDLWDDYVSML